MSGDWPTAKFVRDTLENSMGLTALDLVHGFTVPQLVALWGDGSPARESTTKDPAALRPGERVITSAQLAARLQRKKELARD